MVVVNSTLQKAALVATGIKQPAARVWLATKEKAGTGSKVAEVLPRSRLRPAGVAAGGLTGHGIREDHVAFPTVVQPEAITDLDQPVIGLALADGANQSHLGCVLLRAISQMPYDA
jgi:hypothetical protein